MANGSSGSRSWKLKEGLQIREWLARFAAGDSCCRDLLIDHMQQMVSADGLLSGPVTEEGVFCGEGILFALDQTGEERYKKAADQLAAALNDMPQPESGWPLWKTQPFCAAYDVRFGGRQQAKAIAERFRKAREAWLADPENGDWYYLSLADTLEKMDSQIYEHYRMLADLLLEAARHAARMGVDAFSHMAVSYAVLKGVRLGLLDPERYLPLALQAVEACLSDPLLPLAKAEYRRAER